MTAAERRRRRRKLGVQIGVICYGCVIFVSLDGASFSHTTAAPHNRDRSEQYKALQADPEAWEALNRRAEEHNKSLPDEAIPADPDKEIRHLIATVSEITYDLIYM